MNLEKLNWQNSEEVAINNEITSAIIEDASDTLNFYADKYIITKYPIKTGNRVEYEGFNYLIISQIDRNKNNYRARIRQADHNIKFNFQGNIKEFPATIDSGSFDIQTGQYISFEIGKIIVSLSDIDNITVGQRFIKMDSAWKVVGVDKTKLGLITLHCNKDEFNVDDDRENEIADRYKYNEPTEPDEPIGDYRITIDGSDFIYFGREREYVATVYNGDEVVEKEVVWSLDNNLATIISQDGLELTIKGGNSYGYVMLRCELADDSSVYIEKEILIRSIM